MSKNIEQLLNSLGITDTNLVEAILSETESPESVDKALKAAQSYAKPFIESEFNTKLDSERKTWKGKYFQTAARDANKEFGNKLTNAEMEEIISDPANEGNTYQAVIKAIKSKTTNSGDNVELQKMLDLANGKLADFERQIPEIETKYKTQYQNEINQFKIDGVVSRKLIEILTGKTAMDPTKAAELLKGQLSKRALLKLKDDGNIGLYDLVNNDSPLKKNETTLETFEGLVEGLVSDYGLAAKSKGTEQKDYGNNNNNQQHNNTQPTGLAAKLAAVTSE